MAGYKSMDCSWPVKATLLHLSHLIGSCVSCSNDEGEDHVW